MKTTLVVGGDGGIGRSLVDYWRSVGAPVVATTRRRDDHGSDLFLDLRDGPDDLTIPPDCDAAVICAAATSIEGCRRDPEGTRRINVEGTMTLARELRRSGIFQVFLSTNLVFGGVRRLPAEEDEVDPRTEYARQKVDAERALLELIPGAAIVRLTKVVSGELPLLSGWIGSLRDGRSIFPFSDLHFSPITMCYVVGAIRRIVEYRKGGVWHVSGQGDESYAGFAMRIARFVGAAEGLVQPRTIAESGLTIESEGPFSALGANRLAREFGLSPQSVEEVVSAVVKDAAELAPRVQA
jgi:dTDP-4-dehydrorhamnose reductase